MIKSMQKKDAKGFLVPNAIQSKVSDLECKTTKLKERIQRFKKQDIGKETLRGFFYG